MVFRRVTGRCAAVEEGDDLTHGGRIEEIGKNKYNSMIGVGDYQRIDEALYDNYESAKDREKRLAKEARFQEVQAKNASLGKKVKEAQAGKAYKSREASVSFF